MKLIPIILGFTFIITGCITLKEGAQTAKRVINAIVPDEVVPEEEELGAAEEKSDYPADHICFDYPEICDE